MSSCEWLIEQDSPNGGSGGMTTHILLDLTVTADDAGDVPTYGSSLSGADEDRFSGGGRGGSGGRGRGVGVWCLGQHRREERGRGASSVTVILGGSHQQKDTARSEGGSSRRSSKRSNENRSRRRQFSSTGSVSSSRGNGGGSASTASRALLAPSGATYTSAALRQRYQRVLFGGGRADSSSAVVAGTAGRPISVSDAHRRGSTPTSERAATSAQAPSTFASDCDTPRTWRTPRVAMRHGQRQSTLFFSTYGAELLDDEENGRNGVAPRRGRCDSASASINGCSIDVTQPAKERVDTLAVSILGTTRRRQPHITEDHPEAQAPQKRRPHAVEAWAGGTSARSSADTNNYVAQRDGCAARATCPGTTTAVATAFPEFPPLHPICMDEEEGEGRQRPYQAAPQAPTAANGYRSSIDRRTESFWEDRLRMRREEPPQHPPGTPSISVEEVNGVFESLPKYNKMLLKKERQRRRVRGWSPSVLNRGGDGEEVPVRVRPSDKVREVVKVGKPRGGKGCSDRRDPCQRRAVLHNEVDTTASSSSSTDASSSSLECYSTASSDDADERELRADAVFSATVLSLASRAERERKRLEAKEEPHMRDTPVQREEVASSAVLRRRDDSALGASRGSALKGGSEEAKAAAFSSFFISPIHQSVAAESATWATGTGLRFLGQGGLTHSSRMFPSAPPPTHPGQPLAPLARPSERRRRSRPDSPDGVAEEDVEERNARADGGLGSAFPHAWETASDCPASRRVLKRRKKGDRAQQPILAECGGSRALRPMSTPSNRPPLEMLPSSKADMREDLLESYLMEAVLDEDDFHLY